ncbi:hypothetical protein [Dactylosporangium sp. NPDC051541]|uniref:hypothetical protein n=1 Tax=Dactylosporangium sp. NPDC051541 TaxID=3363977 RepID=UPI0037892CEC
MTRQRAALVAGFFVGPVAIALGLLWLLAFVPGVAEHGSVTTTYCDAKVSRQGPTCAGDFIPDDGGPPRWVTIRAIHEQHVTARAVMFPWAGNQAWPPFGAGDAALFLGVTLTGAAILTATIRRLLRRRSRFP